MFNKPKKTQCVSNIVHLEIGFMLEEIMDWESKGYKGDLLDEKKLAHNDIWGINAALKFKVTLLPHPNGTDTIFLHHHENTFSNYLNASVGLFSNSILEEYPELKKYFSTIGWFINRTGTICAWIQPHGAEYFAAKKGIIAVPTNDIFQLQLGILENNIENYHKPPGETTLEISASQKDTFKVKRSLLGLHHARGVGYRNILGFVKAHLPEESMWYTLPDKSLLPQSIKSMIQKSLSLKIKS